MFHYHQLPTADPEGSGNSDGSGSDLLFVTAEEVPLPEQDVQPPCQPQKKKVSCACFVLISCHKQLSLKLHINLLEPEFDI